MKYSRMKILHFQDKLYSLPREVDQVLAPIHVRVKPSNRCNHNCSYCAYRLESLSVGRDMSVADQMPRDKLLELLDDFIEMGVKAVTFSGGGEPFLYPHLAQAAARLAESSVAFAALTNGSRLEGEAAAIFASSATWVRVSIDGYDDESYTHYRRVDRGEFSRVMNNMAAFKRQNGPCHLGLSMIVDHFNAGRIFELARRVKDIGVDSMKISPCITASVGAQNTAFHASVYELARAGIDRVKTELADERFEIFDAYHLLDERFEKNYSWCPNIQILPVVGADLNVYCCQDKAYNNEGILGSIKDIRFKDFWRSDKSKFFRINPSRQCAHHCVASAKNKLVLEFLGSGGEHAMFV